MLPIIETGISFFEAIAIMTIAKIVQAIPKDVNMIPPLLSWFHEMSRRAIKINEGIL